MTWWSKLFSLCPEDTFEEINFFFHKIFKIFICFQTLRKHFGFLAKLFLLGCQNCILWAHWRFLMGQFFLCKSLSIFTVPGLWGKHSSILAQKHRKVCQNCNWCVQKISVKYWFLTKLVLFFRVLIKNFADFCQKMLSKRIILGKVPFFCGKKSFLTTEVEGEGFWCSVRTFGSFIEAALFVSEWDFWLNCFFYEFFWFSSLFSDCEQNLLQHWRKSFR